MTTASARKIIEPGDMECKPLLCPVPRPGDAITWFEDGVRQQGTLLGSLDDGSPYIKRSDGPEHELDSFTAIRVTQPSDSAGPAWEDLPPGGLIARATDDQARAMDRLADLEVPPGITHRVLAEEIWLRGFEVFYAGWPVRAALDGRDPGTAELVTTMPLDRLRRILRDMYGVGMTDAGETALAAAGAGGHAVAGGGHAVPWPDGAIRVGGLAGTADPYAVVRTLRYGRYKSPTHKESSYISGASLGHDMRFGDFTVNAVYFEPRNSALIDPSGTGLDDIAGTCLRPVRDRLVDAPEQLGYTGIRVVRQYLLKDRFCDEDAGELLGLVRCINGLRHIQLVTGLKAYLYGCLPGDPMRVMTDVRGFFEEFGLMSLYESKIQPCLGDIES